MADKERINWDCHDPGTSAVWELLVAEAKEKILPVNPLYSFGSMTAPSGALGSISHIMWYAHLLSLRIAGYGFDRHFPSGKHETNRSSHERVGFEHVTIPQDRHKALIGERL